jgi:hypothetical protein
MAFALEVEPGVAAGVVEAGFVVEAAVGADRDRLPAGHVGDEEAGRAVSPAAFAGPDVGADDLVVDDRLPQALKIPTHQPQAFK